MEAKCKYANNKQYYRLENSFCEKLEFSKSSYGINQEFSLAIKPQDKNNLEAIFYSKACSSEHLVEYFDFKHLSNSINRNESENAKAIMMIKTNKLMKNNEKIVSQLSEKSDWKTSFNFHPQNIFMRMSLSNFDMTSTV